MFCTKCGHQNPGGAAFCARCGTPSGSGAGSRVDRRGVGRRWLPVILGVVCAAALAVGLMAGAARLRSEGDEEQRNLDAIEGTVRAYAESLTDMDFDRAAGYCVPGSDPVSNVLDAAPQASALLQGAKDLLGMFIDTEDYLRCSITADRDTIKLSGDTAALEAEVTVTASFAGHSMDYQNEMEIYLVKADGEWLIESFQ